MDIPTGLPKPLPQQPLIGPTGARLVLCRLDAGSHNKGPAGKGRWFDNIADTDAKIFLRAMNKRNNGYTIFPNMHLQSAVVLTPEEYKLQVGCMSLIELQSHLEKYWGRGAVPGTADYQDMWIPAWESEYPENTGGLLWCSVYTGTPRLDPSLFRRWVNSESSKWLWYFIDKNHTFGVVHAWFAAFIGVIRASLVELAEKLTNMEAMSHLKFRMSFDLCIKDFDDTVNGIPSLPLDTKTTTQNGMQVITSTINDMFPRRIWDICANTVIPATWFCGPPCPLTTNVLVDTIGVVPVSHAWAASDDLAFTLTEANQQLWPIPLPRGVQLEDIRGHMIRLGVRYAWLDVLCLRQQAQPALATGLALPASQGVVERREQHRLEEWKVDVPTIGAIYSNQYELDLYGEQPTVIFMSGLGRPFRAEGWTNERHWLRRVWTLQETPVLSRCVIAGLPEGVGYLGSDVETKVLTDDVNTGDDDNSNSDTSDDAVNRGFLSQCLSLITGHPPEGASYRDDVNSGGSTSGNSGFLSRCLRHITGPPEGASYGDDGVNIGDDVNSDGDTGDDDVTSGFLSKCLTLIAGSPASDWDDGVNTGDDFSSGGDTTDEGLSRFLSLIAGPSEGAYDSDDDSGFDKLLHRDVAGLLECLDSSDDNANTEIIWPWNCKVCNFFFSFSLFSLLLFACGLYHGELLECLMRGRNVYVSFIVKYLLCY